MPNSKVHCGLPENHTGKCRTPGGARKFNQRTAAYNQQRAAERSAEIDEIKLKRGCERCGWREHALGLDWDHLDPSLKIANISRLVRYSTWKAIRAELEKCRVLCSNCHRIWTLDPASYILPADPQARRKAGPPAAHSS